MNGARNDASEEPESASLAAVFFATAALALWPVRDEVAAGRLVMVEACDAVPGRAAGFCFEPVTRLNQSAIEDFGLIVCALAIGLFLLRAYFQEPLLANEGGQIELEPAGTAGIRICARDPWERVGRPLRGRELFRIAKSQHARNQQARAPDEAIGDEDHAALDAGWRGIAALEGGEVEHAVEVAANVGQAAEPRLGQGHAHRRRYRNHFVHLVQGHEPALGPDLEAQLRRQRRARRGRANPLRDRKLEFPKSRAP